VLILTRKSEQGIIIAGDVTVRVLAIEGERVKLGIDAPRSISVLYEELVREVSGENRLAAHPNARQGLAAQLRALKAPRRATSHPRRWARPRAVVAPLIAPPRGAAVPCARPTFTVCLHLDRSPLAGGADHLPVEGAAPTRRGS